MCAAAFLPQHRRQRRKGVPDGSDQSKIDWGATAEVAPADVDLNYLGIVGIELLIRKVGAQHQQRVGLFDGLVSRSEAEQTGHADVERVVVFDELLAAQRMNDRSVERARQLDQ